MQDSKIKILIVSRTPWNEANSFGNTFTNIFTGIEDIEIANICCQGGAMNSRLIEESFQLTDNDVARSIFGYRPGRLIYNTAANSSPSASNYNVPRKAIFYALREVVWNLGHWKSKALKRFILDFKPDVLYLPIYRSHYMCEVDKYVISLTKAPYVVHITDDVYGFLPETSGLAGLLQRIIRNDIRQILKNASYGEVFSPLMAEEYGEEFKIPFYVIGKSIEGTQLPEILRKKSSGAIHFVYTGNYGGERGAQLVSLAKAISEVFTEGAALLDIYSATKADNVTESQLSALSCVRLLGAVSPDRILPIQQQADYLIHVEGFTPRAVFESRLSFSTKIIDYLIAGRPIVAIGPQDVTSIHVLKGYNMAFVATDKSEMKGILSKIKNGQTDDDIKVDNGRKYLLNQRDGDKMKTEIHQRFMKLLQK